MSASQNDLPLQIRIGINAGEPVTEGGDFFGVAVQLTARLCSLCAPDKIVASLVVKSLCMGREIKFSNLGAKELKGFMEPVDVFEIVFD